jgi:glycosyltransferase involved in cell wall biosynthesis
MLNEYCHNIDFVGPVRDDGRFEFKNGNNYLGVWNKTQLFENLGKYACLILASRGEAAPLVVPEAMACGLSLVLSQQSTANMVDKPWIKIIDIYNDNYLKNYLLADIHNIIIENQKQRFDIKNFAQNTYDWNVIADDYIEIIKNCK